MAGNIRPALLILSVHGLAPRFSVLFYEAAGYVAISRFDLRTEYSGPELARSTVFCKIGHGRVLRHSLPLL